MKPHLIKQREDILHEKKNILEEIIMVRQHRLEADRQHERRREHQMIRIREIQNKIDFIITQGDFLKMDEYKQALLLKQQQRIILKQQEQQQQQQSSKKRRKRKKSIAAVMPPPQEILDQQAMLMALSHQRHLMKKVCKWDNPMIQYMECECNVIRNEIKEMMDDFHTKCQSILTTQEEIRQKYLCSIQAQKVILQKLKNMIHESQYRYYYRKNEFDADITLSTSSSSSSSSSHRDGENRQQDQDEDEDQEQDQEEDQDREEDEQEQEEGEQEQRQDHHPSLALQQQQQKPMLFGQRHHYLFFGRDGEDDLALSMQRILEHDNHDYTNFGMLGNPPTLVEVQQSIQKLQSALWNNFHQGPIRVT